MEYIEIRINTTGMDADEFMDNLYNDIKQTFLCKDCNITPEHLESLAELLKELSARTKENGQ